MKTVFHVTEEARFQGAVHSAFNLLIDESVEIEEAVIIANGGAVRGFLKGSRFEDLAVDAIGKGIRMRACNNSLFGMRIDKTRLVDGVEIVPSGVGELTRFQSSGYAYIRV